MPVTGTPGGGGGTLRSITQLLKKVGQTAWDALTAAEKKKKMAKHMKPGYNPTGLLRDEAKRQAYLKKAAE